MATDRQKRSRALQRLTIESERARLKDPRLSQQQIRETYTQIKALQRADREKGEALAEQREKERQALAERRQRARDNRAATYVPSWDSPTHSHPAEKERLEARRQQAADQRAATTWTPTWDQPIHEPPTADYDQDGNPYDTEGGEL